jgi:hypothetical protein
MATLKEKYEASDKNINPLILDKTPFSDDASFQIDKKGLYFTNNIYKFGTNYSKIKSDRETLVEQEISGIRIKSAVELNNPLIYGNESIRIATRSTSSVEKMKQATGGTAGGGGLIGQGLSAITGGGLGRFVFGGQVSSISQARDGFNSRLGIPTTLIPTSIYNTGELQKGIEPNTMITLSKIKNDANGTEFGKFLKQTGGGNFRTIGRNILGQGISLVKDKLRTTLFGGGGTLGTNTPANNGYEYSSKTPYSDVIRDSKLNEVDTDKIQVPGTDIVDPLKKLTTDGLNKRKSIGDLLGGNSNISPSNGNLYTNDENPYSLQTQPFRINDSNVSKVTLPNEESINQIKQDTQNKLISKKPLDETQESIDYDEVNKYSKNVNDTLTTKDSRETKLQLPTQESDTQKVQDDINLQQDKKPIGETVEKKEYNNENTYSKQTREAELNEDRANYQRIDLSLVSPVRGLDRKISDGRYGKTEYGFSDARFPAGGLSEFSPKEGENYSSTLPFTLDKIGLTSNNGDRINIMGMPTSDGRYTDGQNELSKDDMEKSDLVPFWISGLNSSSPVFFRTLITGLTETVSPSWSGNKFVGNPYNYYTYGGVERSVSFNLKLYCMNQTELIKNWERVSFLTSKAYPNIKNNLVNPPFIKFRLGDIYNNKTGFIESLSYTMPDGGVWETEIDGSLLPKFIDVALTIKFVEVPGSELSLYSYQKSQEAIQAKKAFYDPAPEPGQFGEFGTDVAPGFEEGPVTGGETPKPVIDAKTGETLDSNDSVEPANDKSKQGVTNISTGKKETTPSQNNTAISDGPTVQSISSDSNNLYQQKLTEIKKSVNDDEAAKKLAKRYASIKDGLQLLELRKESDTVYYVKEYVSRTGAEREFVYKSTTVTGTYPNGYVTVWSFMNWAKYQKSLKGKSVEQDDFGNVIG